MTLPDIDLEPGREVAKEPANLTEALAAFGITHERFNDAGKQALRDFYPAHPADALLSIADAHMAWALVRVLERAKEAGRREMRAEAIAAIRAQQASFLSPEYSTGQPLASWGERFACDQCITAIALLSPSPPTNPHQVNHDE